MTVVDIIGSGAGAGVLAVLVTVAIERWGGRVGGLLGTLPTTIVPASWGIWSQSADAVAFEAAMFGVPPAMLLNAVFLWIWRVGPAWLPPWRIGARLLTLAACALAVWGVLAITLVVVVERVANGRPDARVPIGVIGFVGLVVVGLLGSRRSRPAPAGARRVGVVVLVARGLGAGAAVAVAVWISSTGSALAAGVASVFPAIFLTTMVSLWISQGEAVPAGAVGPMMLGSASVGAFAILASSTIPAWGPPLGATAAWLGAAGLVTAPAFWWLRRRARSAADAL